ncbi:MAG: hypothetical protein AAB815_00135 [Patescibacteria group bacterium]
MESDQKIKSKSIETYAEDMAAAIETGEEGLVKKIIHEQEKQEEEKKNLSPESQKNKLFMFTGATLIFLGLLVLVSLLVFGKNIYTVSVSPLFAPIIFTDRTDFIEITGFDKQKIADSINTKVDITEVKMGGVEGVYLTENKKVVGLKRLLELVEANFPPEQIALVNDNFFIGILGKNADANQQIVAGDLFFLLQARSFADVFPAMRFWEHKMFFDLHDFFGINITPENNYLLTKNFEDGIVENKNARMLYDQAGNITMMYVFANDTSLIITNSSAATYEAILRLSSGEVRK